MVTLIRSGLWVLAYIVAVIIMGVMVFLMGSL